MRLTDIEFTSDSSRVDVELIHRLLGATYWAQGRSRTVVERSIQNSLCFSAFHASQQIAFGRVITDRAVFAYIADVIVVPEHRGMGIGKALVNAMLRHPDVQELQVILLRTRDAGGLYARFGFEAIRKPEEMMAFHPARPQSGELRAEPIVPLVSCPS